MLEVIIKICLTVFFLSAFILIVDFFKNKVNYNPFKKFVSNQLEKVKLFRVKKSVDLYWMALQIQNESKQKQVFEALEKYRARIEEIINQERETENV